jgi:hypothetical protein
MSGAAVLCRLTRRFYQLVTHCETNWHPPAPHRLVTQRVTFLSDLRSTQRPGTTLAATLIARSAAPSPNLPIWAVISALILQVRRRLPPQRFNTSEWVLRISECSLNGVGSVLPYQGVPANRFPSVGYALATQAILPLGICCAHV